MMRASKAISLSLSAALIVGMVGITGCGTNTSNKGLTTQNVRTNKARGIETIPQGSRQFSRSLGSGNVSKLDNVKYSEELSKKVAQLSTVHSAHVLLSDDEAFVGVTLRDHTHGISAKNNLNGGNYTGNNLSRSDNSRIGVNGNNGISGRGMGTRGITGTGTGTGTGLGLGTGTTGTGLGTGTTGTGLGTGTTGTGLGTGTMGTGLGTGTMGTGLGTGTTGTRLGTGTTGTGLGTGITGTGTGYMGTGYDGTGTGHHRTDGHNNAGIFGAMNDGTHSAAVSDVPQTVKDQVAAEIKKNAPEIRTVHVTNHPDFVTHATKYSTGVTSTVGNGLKTLGADFRSLVDRIFPSRTGTMTGPSGYTPTQYPTLDGTGAETGTGVRGSRGVTR